MSNGNREDSTEGGVFGLLRLWFERMDMSCILLTSHTIEGVKGVCCGGEQRATLLCCACTEWEQQAGLVAHQVVLPRDISCKFA